MTKLCLKNVTKVFPNGYKAVNNVSVEVESGQFCIIVGPSGSGKTTLLRIIAGLETQTSGEIEIGGRLVNNIAPKDRQISMVFQNYALFPHLTVFDNIAFPLKMRKVNKKDILNKINKAAVLLRIESLLGRRPAELSGGQRQRVAIGRAIVKEPKVFLFDEPCSNLDFHLRSQMREELKKIQKETGATTLYVTHDQNDAKTLGDTLCFMNQGKLKQMGSLEQVSLNPLNEFMSGFLASCD